MTNLESKIKIDETLSVFDDAYSVLAEPIYTYGDEEGLLWDEYPFEDLDWHTGVSKVCIILPHCVLKTGFSGVVDDYDWEEDETREEPIYEDWEVDYARTEYEIYKRACEEGVSKFFAEMIDMGMGIFAQELCSMTLDNVDYADEEDLRISKVTPMDEGLATHAAAKDFCIEYGLFDLFHRTKEGLFIRYAVNQYKIGELLNLQRFLQKYDINDIHNGNVGFCDGKIKLIDYCGYKSATSDRIKEFLD